MSRAGLVRNTKRNQKFERTVTALQSRNAAAIAYPYSLQSRKNNPQQRSSRSQPTIKASIQRHTVDTPSKAHLALDYSQLQSTRRDYLDAEVIIRHIARRELVKRKKDSEPASTSPKAAAPASVPKVAAAAAPPNESKKEQKAAAKAVAPPKESKKEQKVAAKAAAPPKESKQQQKSAAKQEHKAATTAATPSSGGDSCTGKHGIKHSICETGRHAKNFGKSLKHDFQKLGHGIETAAKTVYNKAIKPAAKWVGKHIKEIAIDAGTAIGGALLDVVTLGAATPLTAGLEATVVGANVAKDAVEVARVAKTAEEVGKAGKEASEAGKAAKGVAKAKELAKQGGKKVLETAKEQAKEQAKDQAKQAAENQLNGGNNNNQQQPTTQK